jgi:hypothetical protein
MNSSIAGAGIEDHIQQRVENRDHRIHLVTPFQRGVNFPRSKGELRRDGFTASCGGQKKKCCGGDRRPQAREIDVRTGELRRDVKGDSGRGADYNDVFALGQCQAGCP